jgi:hypothetical protein
MKFTYWTMIAALLTIGSCKNESPSAPVNGTTCYESRLQQDLTAVQLTLNGDDVTGFYAWEPHEKDAGRGSFKGKKSGDLITVDFTYMIEGSVQSEEMVFKLDGKQLRKANGELEDKMGKMVIKDKSKLSFDEVFTAVDCAKIKPSIDRAMEMAKLIEQQPAEEEEAVEPNAIPLTGVYSYDNGDQGSGELLVQQTSYDGFDFKLMVVGRAPAHNQGTMEGSAKITPNGVAVYTTKEFGECSLQFTWANGAVSIKTLKGDPAACGFGNAVMADGDYKRTNFTNPFLSKKDAQAMSLLQGTWQSAADTKFSIIIKDGLYTETYEGSAPIPTVYIYHPTCPKDCNPVAPMPCLKIMGQDDVCFTVVKADGKTLELSQIGGTGNTNKYVKKK